MVACSVQDVQGVSPVGHDVVCFDQSSILKRWLHGKCCKISARGHNVFEAPAGGRVNYSHFEFSLFLP